MTQEISPGLSLYLNALTKAQMGNNLVPKENDAYFESDYYNGELDGLAVQKVGKENFILIQYIRFKVIDLLLCSKKNELLLARQLNVEIKNLLDAIPEALVRKLILLSYLPGKSYYDYKLKDFEAAINLSVDAITLDDYLEAEGFDILRFHKLQQVNNIARIHYVKKDYETWSSLMSSCLSYAFLRTTPYQTGKWGHYSFERPEKEELLLSFVFQILNEAIVFDYYLKNKYLFKILKPIFFNPGAEFLAFEIHRWGKLMFEIHDDNSDKINENIIEYLEIPSSKFDLLKFALISYHLAKDCGVEDRKNLRLYAGKLDIPKTLKINLAIAA